MLDWHFTKALNQHFSYRVHQQWYHRYQLFWMDQSASTPDGNEADDKLFLSKRRQLATQLIQNSYQSPLWDRSLQRSSSWYGLYLWLWVPRPHSSASCYPFDPEMLPDANHGSEVAPMWGPCGAWWHWEDGNLLKICLRYGTNYSLYIKQFSIECLK